jgi:phage tail sheath protein FI
MPQYLHPGVYVEEVPPLARPIAGVGTSTPGFIGVIPDPIHLPAPTRPSDAAADVSRGFKFVDFSYAGPGRATAGRAFFISSWTQYTKLFGDFLGDDASAATTAAAPSVDPGQRNLAQAVYGFFNNGGAACYVVRVARPPC